MKLFAATLTALFLSISLAGPADAKSPAPAKDDGVSYINPMFSGN